MFDRFEAEGSRLLLAAAFKLFEQFPPGQGDDGLRYQLAALNHGRHLFTGWMLEPRIPLKQFFNARGIN